MQQQRQARRGRPPTTSTMKEHPILFSAPMILALLAGTKTQTRRIINPQPKYPKYTGRVVGGSDGNWGKHLFSSSNGQQWEALKSPFGQDGDCLWVRETCRAEELPDGTNGVRYLADNHFQPISNTPEAAEQWVKLYHYGKRHGATVPPIHTPRWTSRLLLEKVAGRVEQLQSISEADAQAEGVEVVLVPTSGTVPAKKYRNYQGRAYGDGANLNYAAESYRTLWESLHGPGSWEANPWLWVEEFKRIQP
jgi:hypothetical protein